MAERVTTLDRLLESFEVGPADLERIRSYGEIVLPRLGDFVKKFYAWLERQPEFHEHFGDATKLARVQGLQADYWADFFHGQAR